MTEFGRYGVEVRRCPFNANARLVYHCGRRIGTVGRSRGSRWGFSSMPRPSKYSYFTRRMHDTPEEAADALWRHCRWVAARIKNKEGPWKPRSV